VSDGGRVGTDDLEPAAAPTAEAAVDPVSFGDAPPSELANTPERALPGTAWHAPATQPGAPPTTMRNISGLAASLTVVLWVSVAVSIFGAVAFANRAAVAGDILDFDVGRADLADVLDLQQRSDDADSLVGAASLLMLGCSLAILVLLVVWMWRVAKNAEASGRERPRFAAGWTIGGWFVPFANLVIPVLVMQDLWRASDATVPLGDPEWRRARGSALVGWWWAAHLLALLRFGGGGDVESRDDLEALRTMDGLAAFGMVAAIAAAILLVSVVRRLSRRQEVLFAG
jgi:hypothetical protein